MRSPGIFALPALAFLLLYACVGDDPDSTSSSSGSSSGSNDAAVDDTGTSSSGGSSGADTGADVDPDPGPHGDTLAQAEIKSPAFFGSIVPASGGGAIISWTHQGPAPMVLGKTPDTTNGSAILGKVNAALTSLDWWVTFQAGSKLARSPDGSVYWLAEMGAGGTPNTATLKGSFGTDTAFTIDGGGNGQGEEAGGAFIVVAMNSDGTRRWTHVLALKSPAMAGVHFISNVRTFAASDKVVLFTAIATGTLEYTNNLGNRVTIACDNDFIMHEIDATNGRTREIIKVAQTAVHQKINAGAGSIGYNGEGFVGFSEDWPANGSSANKRYVALLESTNVGVAAWNKLETNLAELDAFGANLYKSVFPIVYASPKAAVSFTPTAGQPQTYSPPGANADAMFFLFDNAAPKVKAAAGFGGAGLDVAKFVADARNGDIYGGGHYRSSDMNVANVQFPPPPDSNTDQAFAVRMRVDEAQGKLVPTWARHFDGSARLAVWGGAADELTGDLYMFGWLSKGKAAFGLGDITSPGVGYDTTHWLVKIRR